MATKCGSDALGNGTGSPPPLPEALGDLSGENATVLPCRRGIARDRPRCWVYRIYSCKSDWR